MAQKGATLTREQKTFSFQAKEFDDAQGIVRGYLSTFDNVDDGGDRVRPGAFKRTLSNKYQYKQQHNTAYLFPLLWQHDTTQPIGGYLEAKEDKVGLFVEVQIDLDVQRGKEAYSALKKGYIFQQSIGYEPLDVEYVKVDGNTVRDLKEIRLWEGSIVTIPMNELAIVTDIKSSDDLELKTVCGNTSGPIGPRDEAWDGSAAKNQIWDAAYNDETKKINTSLAKKYFMVVDGDPQQKGSYGYPFWYVGSSPHICVGAVKAIAAAIQGARGASPPSGLKAKVETLYNRINAKYPDDPELTPPWFGDGKRSHMNVQRKTFETHYNEEMAEDLLEDLWEVWFVVLCKALVDAFTIGDEPESDVNDVLTAFHTKFLEEWLPRAIASNMTEYLASEDIDSPLNPSGPYSYGYMSRRKPLTRKAMLAGDATTGGFTTEHVTKLQKCATKAMKAIESHVQELHDAAEEITTLIGGSDQQVPTAKGRALSFVKAGRSFSGANAQALSKHAAELHDLADQHNRAMNRFTKTVNTIADDMATTMQGAEDIFAADPGTPDEGRQEGKRTLPRTPFNDRTRTTQPIRSSHDDTVSDEDIVAALAKLTALKATH